MDKLFAERFKSARAMKGYSLQELADRLENRISRQALHKYETGQAMPDSEMVALLSETLGVRPDYFFRELTIVFGDVEFRKLKNVPVKEENRIIESVKDRLARYLELEDIMGIVGTFANPLADFGKIESGEQVEEAAEKIREIWGLGGSPIFNTLELLEDRHIKVIEVSGGHTGFDGMQTVVNGNIPVIAINRDRLKSLDRIRFTVLHELAHVLLELKHLPEKEKEKYCHRFAGALLFPRQAVFAELGESRSNLLIQELAAIKKHYGISIQAIVMRATALGIISQAYCRQFFFYLNQMGWKQTEPYEYVGEEASGRFDQLLFRALAEELITTGKAAALRNETIAEFREKFLLGA